MNIAAIKPGHCHFVRLNETIELDFRKEDSV
jgi:hypothetical protein